MAESDSSGCPQSAPDLSFDGPGGRWSGSVFCPPTQDGFEIPNEQCEILVLQIAVLTSQVQPVTGRVTLFSDDGSPFALQTEHDIRCF